MTTCAPLLKYPGGKRKLATRISAAFGGRCSGVFYEPFAGSAAVTLHRRQAGEVGRAVLSDLDPWLVAAHRGVAADPGQVCAELAEHRAGAWTRERYEELVGRLNGGEVTAAHVIALNKTCFNGLYRKNQLGAWNVAWNETEAPGFPPDGHIMAVGAALSGVKVLQRAALGALAEAGAGDHVYLDPPYVGTWTGYGQGGTFGWSDLAELVRAAEAAARRGARTVLSHLDDVAPPAGGLGLAPPVGPVRSLLRAWEIETVDVAGSISCDGETRGKRREVIARIGGGA